MLHHAQPPPRTESLPAWCCSSVRADVRSPCRVESGSGLLHFEKLTGHGPLRSVISSSANFPARGSMPSKHPRSSRMAARRTNFTSKSDVASEGEFIHNEVPNMSSTDDAPTHCAPSPTPTPSTPSSNPLESAEKKSLAQILATYGSPGSSSNLGVWGNGDNTHSTPFTVSGMEEQFPRLREHQCKHASTFQQSNKATSSPAPPHATPRFSLSPRRTRTPALIPPAIVAKLDDATQTSTPTTLIATAQSFIRANPAAALLASSMMRQAASTIQRRFKRHVTRTEFFRKKAESFIERPKNIHFARYLSRVSALEYFHFDDRKLNGSKWEQRNKLQHEPKMGGFPLSMADARALELTIVSTKATCSPSEMTIDSPVVLIFEHNRLSLKVSIGKFPCTRDEWYKSIFWPVHTNGGNYPSDSRANTPLPYAQLATAMRAGGTPEYERGSTIFPRTTKITEELGRSLNRLELRKAPSVRLRLRYASLSAQQRGITLKLKPQY